MDESKLAQAFIASAISVAAAVCAYVVAHLNQIAAMAAIGSAIYAMYAAHWTAKVRKRQNRKLDEETDI